MLRGPEEPRLHTRAPSGKDGAGGGPASHLVVSGEENWVSLRTEAKPRPRPRLSGHVRRLRGPPP